jgi:HSP20 family protein
MITSSKMAIATAFLTGLLAMSASTDAYRITYLPRALRRTSPSSLARQSYFPRDIGRMMDDVDELFDSMLGDVNDMFYDSSPFQRMNRPSYLLEGRPATAVAPKRPVNTYSITQDEKQVKMVVTVPGAKASDVKLDLDEDNRTLRISGETKLENDGISVHSRFDKSFTLDRNLDISGVAAEFDDGVLIITAPKFEEVKDSVRRIDVVDNSSSDEEVNDVASENKGDEIEGADTDTEVRAEAVTLEQSKENEVKPEADESVIDLDKDEPFP